MSQQSIRVFAEPIRSIAAAAILAGYSAVGTRLAHACVAIILNNLTDAQVFISMDGVNDHIILAVNQGLVLDINANKSNMGSALNIALGTQFYAKRVAGAATTGSVYISVLYATQ